MLNLFRFGGYRLEYSNGMQEKTDVAFSES